MEPEVDANDVPQAQPQQQKKHSVQRQTLKRDGPLAPRLAAKLKELEARGLLTAGQAHVSPQERN